MKNENLLIWQDMLHPAILATEQLCCVSCTRVFPIVAPDIPVLWSDILRDTYSNLKVSLDNTIDEGTVKAANINVYEATIHAYDSAAIHFDVITTERLLAAVKFSDEAISGLWHLDVGCGSGNVMQSIAKHDSTVHHIGLDVSISSLLLVRQRGFFAVLGDAERIPIKEQSIKLVTASSVLHHLYLPMRFVQEANRVLLPKGIFVTDFDPSKRAADWSWFVKKLYDWRIPIYRNLQRVTLGKRVSHIDNRIQEYNQIAEFHNRPGAGFDSVELAFNIATIGFEVKKVFLHNTRDPLISSSQWTKASPRHIFTQLLSGRNPFLRQNADTILTISQKKEGNE